MDTDKYRLVTTDKRKSQQKCAT